MFPVTYMVIENTAGWYAYGLQLSYKIESLFPPEVTAPIGEGQYQSGVAFFF